MAGSTDTLSQPAPIAYENSARAPSVTVERAGPSLAVKVLYGIGSIGDSLKTFTFGLFLFFFYTSVLGLSGTLVGIASAVGLIWDACIDPAIGHVSDRVRLRYSRSTFMLVGSILAGATFFAVLSPPDGLTPSLLVAWFFLTSLLARTCSSMFMVPYCALGAELSRDYDERTSITAIRAGFALIGTLLAAALSFSVFFRASETGTDAKFDATNYSMMGAAFGFIIAAAGVISALGTRRPRSDTALAHSASSPRFVDGLMSSIRNRPFVVLTVSSSTFFLAAVANATLCIHYLTYYTRLNGSSAITYFQLAFYVGAIIGVVSWLRVAKRADKRLLFLVAAAMTALLMSAAYWAVGDGRLIQPGHLWPLALGNAVAGFFASVIWVVPPSMIADVTDFDESLTGRRREGALFGIYSFAHQGAASIALAATGVLVDRFAGLVPGQAAQSAQTAERLGLLFAMFPAGLMVASAILICFYPLTRARVAALQHASVATPSI